MDALTRIKELRSNANSIKDLFFNKIPKWQKDDHHYDKTGWGFNEDDRFNACNPFYIAFSSHMGTYGDSGCSSQCSLDNEIFRNHFIKYINKHKQEIMLAVAASIEDEARTLKEKAENELNSELTKLKELEQ